jgi:hypothetical protein
MKDKKKSNNHDDTLPSLSEISFRQRKLSLFEGLWKKWKKCGFLVFYAQIRQEIENFLYNPYYSKKDPHHHFFKCFITLINEYYDIDRAFLEARGLQTPFGICWIRYQIQSHYNNHGILPTPSNLSFLRTHLKERDYEKFGYTSWERFIAQNLTEPSPKDRLKFFR